MQFIFFFKLNCKLNFPSYLILGRRFSFSDIFVNNSQHLSASVSICICLGDIPSRFRIINVTKNSNDTCLILTQMNNLWNNVQNDTLIPHYRLLLWYLFPDKLYLLARLTVWKDIIYLINWRFLNVTFKEILDR